MLIHGPRHDSQLKLCIDAAETFLLTQAKAQTIIANQVAAIRQRFDAACDAAGLNQVDRSLLGSRQFLNAYAFEGMPEEGLLTSSVGRERERRSAFGRRRDRR